MDKGHRNEKNLPTPVANLARGLGVVRRDLRTEDDPNIVNKARKKFEITKGEGGFWPHKEDFALFKGVIKYEYDWKLIASKVPGRSEEECKARWNELMKVSGCSEEEWKARLNKIISRKKNKRHKSKAPDISPNKSSTVFSSSSNASQPNTSIDNIFNGPNLDFTLNKDQFNQSGNLSNLSINQFFSNDITNTFNPLNSSFINGTSLTSQPMLSNSLTNDLNADLSILFPNSNGLNQVDNTNIFALDDSQLNFSASHGNGTISASVDPLFNSNLNSNPFNGNVNGNNLNLDDILNSLNFSGVQQGTVNNPNNPLIDNLDQRGQSSFIGHTNKDIFNTENVTIDEILRSNTTNMNLDSLIGSNTANTYNVNLNNSIEPNAASTTNVSIGNLIGSNAFNTDRTDITNLLGLNTANTSNMNTTNFLGSNSNNIDITGLLRANTTNAIPMNNDINSLELNSLPLVQLIQNPHALQALQAIILLLNQTQPDSSKVLADALIKLAQSISGNEQKEDAKRDKTNSETKNKEIFQIYSPNEVKQYQSESYIKNKKATNNKEQNKADEVKKETIKKQNETNKEQNEINEEDDTLYYDLTKGDFPDEMEDDMDFLAKEKLEVDIDAWNSPVIDATEIENLLEDEIEDEPAIEQVKKPKKQKKKGDDALFGVEILKKLREQYQKYLQLLIQTYAIECKSRGPKTQHARYWKTQILLVKKHHDFGKTKSVTKLNEPINYSGEGREFFSFLSVPGADYLGYIVSLIARFKLPPITFHQTKGKKTLQIKKDNEELAAINRMHGFPGCPRETLEMLRVVTHLCNTVLDPISFDFLKPHYLKSLKRSRPVFVPTEDRLFKLGLYKFGDDFSSIRSHILPSRTSKQLENRFNNLKSRRTPFNPVQEYYLRQIKPLTIEEEELLTAGVRHYGKKFKLISQRILPQRPCFILRKAWKEMEYRISQSKASE